jgi:hypothetical protein
MQFLLITLRNVDLTTNMPYHTNSGLFDQLMNYLHDNGFGVLTSKQLGYNTQTNTFYLGLITGSIIQDVQSTVTLMKTDR